MKNFTTIPNELFDKCNELGITSEELALLAILFRYWYKRTGDEAEDPHPRTETLGESYGKNERWTQRQSKSLEEKGYLKRYYGKNKRTYFNLIPLMDALKIDHGFTSPMLKPEKQYAHTDASKTTNMTDREVHSDKYDGFIPTNMTDRLLYKEEEDSIKKTTTVVCDSPKTPTTKGLHGIPHADDPEQVAQRKQIDELCGKVITASQKAIGFGEPERKAMAQAVNQYGLKSIEKLIQKHAPALREPKTKMPIAYLIGIANKSEELNAAPTPPPKFFNDTRASYEEVNRSLFDLRGKGWMNDHDKAYYEGLPETRSEEEVAQIYAVYDETQRQWEEERQCDTKTTNS